jgi:hypothetical protein
VNSYLKTLISLIIAWIKRHRRLVAALVITVTVPALILLAFYVWALVTFSFSDFDFPIQDCGGITIAIRGKVLDNNSMPIQSAVISITNVGVGRNAFHIALTAVTDKNGVFQQDNITVLACDELILTASATGYTPETIHVDAYPDEKRNIDHILIRLKRLP